MTDLPSEYQRDVKMYSIGVSISQPDENGEVYEDYRVFDADSEQQAIMMAHNHYQNDDWVFNRLRHVKKVFSKDE